MSQIRPFVLFLSFLNINGNIAQNLTINGKGINGVLGIWAQDHKVGAVESTELKN